MSTSTMGREARERQLLLAAIRQLSRSRPADHTYPALACAALGAALLFGLMGTLMALGVPLVPVGWSIAPLAVTSYAVAGLAALLALGGALLAVLALCEATGTKGLALLALLGNAAVLVTPVLAVVA